MHYASSLVRKYLEYVGVLVDARKYLEYLGRTLELGMF